MRDVLRRIVRAAKTIALTYGNGSDVARWLEPASLQHGWDERTSLLASWVEPGTRVLEFGAGRGVLRGRLPVRCTYVPSDLVRRDRETFVCDLNGDALPALPAHDVALFSGVLEYVHDVGRIADRLGRMGSTVLASYAVRPPADRTVMKRRAHGWVNDYTEDDLVALFDARGFVCRRRRSWGSQRLFLFEPRRAAWTLPARAVKRPMTTALHEPAVSVIMPAFNHARYVGAAIRSVRAQTRSDWELVVVDDGSTDGTVEAVNAAAEGDPRIRVIRQDRGRASAARNAGLAASTGRYAAFLDADDTYAASKLDAHLECLEARPDIGVTYSSRVEMDVAGTPVGFHRAPERLSLRALLVGFPFAPSDMVVRRTWIARAGGFRPELFVHEDRDLYLRLWLEGCAFAHVDGFLSCRRLDGGKQFADLTRWMGDMRRVLAAAFDHPRCAPEAHACRGEAHRSLAFAWAYQAALQGERMLARRYARGLTREAPHVDGVVRGVCRDLVHAATRDAGDHEARLRRVVPVLGEEIAGLSNELDAMLARADLIAGLRAALWSRSDGGRHLLARWSARRSDGDTDVLHIFAAEWMAYRTHVGAEAAAAALIGTSALLRGLGHASMARQLEGTCLMNAAYADDRRGGAAVATIARAVACRPSSIANRGVVAVLGRAVVRRLGSLPPLPAAR